MAAPLTLDLSADRYLAYHRLSAHGDGANLPGVVFLGGFRSDMTGVKAQFLESWARERGRAFLRFDYTGHGASSGRFEDGCIGDWTDDAAEAVSRLTEAPQILVGSSMGGWIALSLAKRMQERIAGLVGIAAAPDFTEDGLWARLSDAQRLEMTANGQIALPSEYSDEPYIYTRKLVEDGRQNLLLRAPLKVPFPVRLLHGTADADVPMSVALRLVEQLDGPDTRLVLVKDADHRFSGERELALIARSIDELEI